MNRRLVITAAASLALMLAAFPLSAQGPGAGAGQRMGGPGRGGRGPGGPGPLGLFPGLNEVGLSDQQREQVRAILEQERQSGGDPGEKVRQAEQGLHAAVLADPPDANAVEAAKVALSNAHTAELDRRVALLQKVAAILTPEQRQQLLQFQPPPGGRRGGGGPAQ